MISKVLTLLILVTHAVSDFCERYTFEENFNELFTNDLGTHCVSMPFWIVGKYSNLDLTGQNERSTSFIQPLSELSCVSSFIFSMNVRGTIEVNIYMEAMDSSDQIIVMANLLDITGDRVTGMATNSASDSSFVRGWHNLTMTLTGSDVYDGYISILGMASPDSIVLVDSFRYIPPGMDESECQLYEEITTPDLTTAATSDSTTIATPDSTTIASSDPITIQTTDPSTIITPDLTTIASPDLTTIPTTHPTAISTLDPTTIVSPDATSIASPDPTIIPTTDPTHITTAEPTIITTPDSTTTASPDATTIASSDPITTQTIDPTITNTPDQTFITTPDPTTITIPDSTAIISPDPSTIQTTNSTATATSDPTPNTTQDPTTIAIPDPTTISTSDSITIATPDPTTTLTPNLTTLSSPDPTNTSESTTITTMTDSLTTSVTTTSMSTEPTENESDDTGAPSTDTKGFWTPLTITMLALLYLIFLALICLLCYEIGRRRRKPAATADDYDFESIPCSFKVPRVKTVYLDAKANPYARRNSW